MCGQYVVMNFLSKLIIIGLFVLSLFAAATTYYVYMVEYDFVIVDDLKETEEE